MRMYVKAEVVRKLFPRFSFLDPEHGVGEGRPRKGIGTRTSFSVQVMQSAAALYAPGFTLPIVTPAKIVQSTAARDLALPIEAYVPHEGLNQVPDSTFCIACTHADSHSSNKIIVRHVGNLIPAVPVLDALCFGRRSVFVFVSGSPCHPEEHAKQTINNTNKGTNATSPTRRSPRK